MLNALHCSLWESRVCWGRGYKKVLLCQREVALNAFVTDSCWAVESRGALLVSLRCQGKNLHFRVGICDRTEKTGLFAPCDNPEQLKWG